MCPEILPAFAVASVVATFVTETISSEKKVSVVVRLAAKWALWKRPLVPALVVLSFTGDNVMVADPLL